MKIIIKLLFSVLMYLSIVTCQQEQFDSTLSERKDSPQTRASDFKATDYYWYDGGKTPIQRMNDKFYLTFYEKDESKMKEIFSKSGAELYDVHKIRDLSSFVISPKDSPEAKQLTNLMAAFVDSSFEKIIEALDSTVYWSPFYKTEEGIEIKVTQSFTVALKSNTDLLKLEKLAEENSVVMIGYDKHISSWYNLACTNSSKGNALEMANLFFDSGLFLTAFPDFISGQLSCINETLYDDGLLWHLGNNILASNINIGYCDVRPLIPSGLSSIKVAIIDAGVQTNHTDLNNVLSGWDTKTESSPNRVYHSHGTEVAGLIGAISNNTDDVAGIAEGVTIIPISIKTNSEGDFEATNIEKKEAFYYAVDNGARVINCSWGGGAANDRVKEGIDYALSNNRIIVFSSGNCTTKSPSLLIGFPVNYDSRIITVGANTQIGERASFSRYGSLLDIVAPGVNVTSTTTGSPSYRTASGTSFAAPQVSATAALILAVNPSLNASQVTDIIEKTAYKLPLYTFGPRSGRTNGTWNAEVGHGMLNTYMAVYFAKQRISGPAVVGTSATTYSLSPMPSGVTNIEWEVVGGGVTPTSGTGATFSITRTNNINDPGQATLKCSFTYRGQVYTMERMIHPRVVPSTPSIYEYSSATMVAYAEPNNQYFFYTFLTDDQKDFVQEYQWEITLDSSDPFTFPIQLSGDQTSSSVLLTGDEYSVRVRVRDDWEWSRWVEKYLW